MNEEANLYCNYKKCRRVLTETAFVTCCSHIFCDEDGIREIESQPIGKKCPACQSPLMNHEVVKVILKPSEQFKSMALAGIRPELVMDIATRSITFWMYQLNQEYLHQKTRAKYWKDIFNQKNDDADVKIELLKAEIQALNRKVEEQQRELENQSEKCLHLSQKLVDQAREVEKWQQIAAESEPRKRSLELMGNNLSRNSENPIKFALDFGAQSVDEHQNQLKQLMMLNNENGKGIFEDSLSFGGPSRPEVGKRDVCFSPELPSNGNTKFFF